MANEEHYVDNEEFQKLLKANKEIVKSYFKEDLESDDFKLYMNNHITAFLMNIRKNKKFIKRVKANKLNEEEVEILIEELRVKEVEKRTNKRLIANLKQSNHPIHKDEYYARIQNKLGRIFLAMSRGILNQPNLINYTWDRKDDMISEATFHLCRYHLLYDTKMTNPFAYFTTVVNRAFWQSINKNNKHTDKFQPLSYIENMHEEDNKHIEDWG